MLAFVHPQTDREYDQTRASLEALNNQLQLANRAASRFRTKLPGRDEAVAQLNRGTSQVEVETNMYAGLFVADVLSVLRSRHGNEISEYLLDELSRKNILPLMPGGKLFRWSAQSVLILWHSNQEMSEISSQIARSCQLPFHCQAFVGTRTAIFQIAVRPAVLKVPKNATKLIRALDRAASGTGA